MKEPEDFNKLLVKAERYCAYQERSRTEVEMKLKKLGIRSSDSIKIINSLEENDFLNEDRFARLFVSGKFRIKRWGRHKIRAELKARRINQTIISAALDMIEEGEYLRTIEGLSHKKWKTIKDQSHKTKYQKTTLFLLSKGFESHYIRKVLNEKSYL